MTQEQQDPGTCPKCGSEAYDTMKWSWQQGITPYADYNVCCCCQHEWSEEEVGEQP